tara:strand:- start:27 stop:515 length:489 start_codon:yes stop_codon:yes gene_type:complete
MDCSVSTLKVTDETGTSRGVEIVPRGCKPVSEDVCKSGFMAPAENVAFPNSGLRQCCKCRDGETCPLCADPSACTDEEKEKFVGVEDCFGKPPPSEETDTEEEAESTAEEEAESTAEEEAAAPASKETETSGGMFMYIISACCVISIIMFMMFRGRRKNVMY